MNWKFSTYNGYVHGTHTFIIRYPYISHVKEEKQKQFRVLTKLVPLDSPSFTNKLHRPEYLSTDSFSPL